jgi:hypothetical protein
MEATRRRGIEPDMRLRELRIGQISSKTGGMVEGAEQGRLRLNVLRLLAALVLVNGLILAPSWVLVDGLVSPWVALEGTAIVGVFLVLPRNRWTVVAAVLVSLAVIVVTLVGVGETTLRLALGRSLSLSTDIWLLRSAWHLMTGTVGPVLALIATLFGLVLVLGVTGGLAHLLVPSPTPRGVLMSRVAGISILAVVSMGLTADRVPAIAGRVATPAVELIVNQTRLFGALKEEREEFAAMLARSRGRAFDRPGILSGLADRDVLLAFVESYGMTALNDPRYEAVMAPRLDDLAIRMRDAGLHIATGKLVAPSQGGQSWFGHGSMLSGYWLDSQLRYDMMLAAPNETLIDDFRAAGHRTVALMPAITLAWPEGEALGYEEIFARNDIDYAGPPLNWVTMPDQFSWSFLESTIRNDDPQPLFVELGLISSHAPWTPILPVFEDWDAIGDGTLFNPFGDAGERPEALWRDVDRVREHYARSVEYAVHVMTGYAERYVDDRTLLIALGDHQPAPIITGADASWEVPVHVISGDASLIQPFLEWGFISGAWPDPDLEAVGMDYFRDWFLQAFSAP